MSYAFYARGYAELYRKTRNQEYLEQLNITLQELLSLQLTPGAWGLPLSWKERKDEPYLITTAFALYALIDGYELTGNEAYFEAANIGVDWVLNKLGKHRDGCFKYSPRVKLVVYNPHAEFMGVLYRYLTFEEDETIRSEAEKALQYLDTKRDSEDLYGYGVHAPHHFDFHVSYILEGLHYAGRNIRKSWNSLINKTMLSNGFMRILHSSKREARAWGYATHLYTGSLINDTKYTPTILKYVYDKLLTHKGVIYRSKDSRVFTRHEAHMFYALVKLGKIDVGSVNDFTTHRKNEDPIYDARSQ